MKLTLVPTNQFAIIDGAECRHWKGETGAGIRCNVFVHRISVNEEREQLQFEREMATQQTPQLTFLEPIFYWPVRRVAELEAEIIRLRTELAKKQSGGVGWGQ